MPLQLRTVYDLMADYRLPSGRSFELHPDEVDILTKVGEVEDSNPVTKQLRERAVVLKSLDGEELPQGQRGLALVEQLSEADALFIGLAWHVIVNGGHIKFPQPVPCPSCSSPIKELDLSLIKCSCTTLEESQQFVQVEGADLSAVGLDGAQGLYIRPSTFRAVRSMVASKHWTNEMLISVARARAGLFKRTSGGDMAPVPLAVTAKWRSAQIRKVIDALELLPAVSKTVEFRCSACGESFEVPFDGAGLRD